MEECVSFPSPTLCPMQFWGLVHAKLGWTPARSTRFIYVSVENLRVPLCMALLDCVPVCCFIVTGPSRLPVPMCNTCHTGNTPWGCELLPGVSRDQCA